jgi:hypothetical protein
MAGNPARDIRAEVEARKAREHQRWKRTGELHPRDPDYPFVTGNERAQLKLIDMAMLNENRAQTAEMARIATLLESLARTLTARGV